MIHLYSNFKCCILLEEKKIPKRIDKEIKTINEDIKEIRREMEDINGKIGQIAREMQIFAKKDEVKTLQKYVMMWEPIKFVTEKQVEEIVKDMTSKK